MNKFLIKSALILLSFPAAASTTYSYSQAENYQKLTDYNQCLPNQDCRNYTNQMRLKGSFTVQKAIPPNVTKYRLTDDMSNLISYEFTDGLVSYTNANSVLADLYFDTDQYGNIINPNVYIQNFQSNNNFVNIAVIDYQSNLSGVHGGECELKKEKQGSGQTICAKTLVIAPGTSIAFNTYGTWSLSTFPDNQSSRGLIGKWVLVGMSLAGQSINCPGQVPLPPGVPESVKQYAQCSAGEFIELAKKQSRGIYFEDITNIPTTSPLGTWTSVRERAVRASKNAPEIPAVDYLIFNDTDVTADPQVYEYALKDNKNSLVIKKYVGVQGIRYPVELIFNKQQ